MAIELISKIVPKNNGTFGMVDAKFVIGGVDNTIPDEAISASSVLQHVTAGSGKGIVSILKTATSGVIDTYTITYTDDTTSTFTVTNGSSAGGTGDLNIDMGNPWTIRQIIENNNLDLDTIIDCGTPAQLAELLRNG